MKLVVFSKEGCMPCHIVKNKLNDLGLLDVSYTLEDSPEKFEEHDVTGTPVVLLTDDEENTLDRMNSFVPHKLDEMIAKRKEED